MRATFLVGVNLSLKLIPAFRFPLGVGVNAVGESIWVMEQGQECLPWATGPGGAGLGNVVAHENNLSDICTNHNNIQSPEPGREWKIREVR